MGGNEASKYTRGLTQRLKLGYGAFPNRFFRFNIFLRGAHIPTFKPTPPLDHFTGSRFELRKHALKVVP
jgi:hypothetical protein